MRKKLVTFICIDIERSTQDSVFQYRVYNIEEALILFEAETKGRYEANDVFVEEL